MHNFNKQKKKKSDSKNNSNHSSSNNSNTSDENKNSLIYRTFINKLDKKYLENNNNKQIVIDFLAGMTDDYFVKQITKINR